MGLDIEVSRKDFEDLSTCWPLCSLEWMRWWRCDTRSCTHSMEFHWGLPSGDVSDIIGFLPSWHLCLVGKTGHEAVYYPVVELRLLNIGKMYGWLWKPKNEKQDWQGQDSLADLIEEDLFEPNSDPAELTEAPDEGGNLSKCLEAGGPRRDEVMWSLGNHVTILIFFRRASGNYVSKNVKQGSDRIRRAS